VNLSTLKKPSAWIPLAMSMAALAVVLGDVAIHGIARDADEGAAAHTWQVLMAGQLPLIAYFAVKWLRPEPRQAAPILMLQIAAAVVAAAPVYLLGL
jgi:hypothetical protein